MKKQGKDNFWKIFLTITMIVIVTLFSSIAWLKFLYLRAPEDITLASELGVNFDPSIDPFKNLKKEPTSAIISGYLYQDSIPFGFEDWSWNTVTNWRSPDGEPTNSFAMKTSFLVPWSGVRLNSSVLDISKFKSVVINIKPEAETQELYIELYDKSGISYGKQALSWYGNNSNIKFGEWNTIQIPIKNLIKESENSISGFSISSKGVGVILVDSIRLVEENYDHAKWLDIVQDDVWAGSDPFKNMTQVNLPYLENFSLESAKSWRELFGTFNKNGNNYLIGPTPKKTTGSMVVFGGGKDWIDYKIDTKVYWGQTSAFAILARFVDDSNFVSCSFSNYGMLVQIYEVKDGKSTLVGQTPPLAIRDYEPWKDVKHSMSVYGNKVTCFMDGEEVISSEINTLPKAGTFGLETWSQNSHDYGHKVLLIEVNSI